MLDAYDANAEAAEGRAMAAEGRAERARQRAVEARRRAGDDEANGDLDEAYRHALEAELAESSVVYHQDAADEQWNHAARAREVAQRS